MRILEIVGTNSTNAKQAAVAAIRRAATHFGEDKLHGGNCGMFALALARFLNELGLDPKLGLIYRCEQRSDPAAESIFSTIRVVADHLQQLIAAEADIYHAFVMLDGKFFDGTGQTDVDAIYAIAEDQYDDRDPGDFTDISIDDPAVLTLIDNDTAWTIPASQFQVAMQPRRATRKPRRSDGRRSTDEKLTIP